MRLLSGPLRRPGFLRARAWLPAYTFVLACESLRISHCSRASFAQLQRRRLQLCLSYTPSEDWAHATLLLVGYFLLSVVLEGCGMSARSGISVRYSLPSCAIRYRLQRLYIYGISGLRVVRVNYYKYHHFAPLDATGRRISNGISPPYEGSRVYSSMAYLFRIADPVTTLSFAPLIHDMFGSLNRFLLSSCGYSCVISNLRAVDHHGLWQPVCIQVGSGGT